MMQEALIIFACYNNTGCGPSLSAYSYYNPEKIQEYGEIYEKIRNKTPNIVIEYIFPIVSILNSSKATFRLSNELITEVNSEKMSITYTIDY